MKFHRSIGEFVGQTYSVTGERLSPEAYAKHVAEVLPNEEEKAFVRSLMQEPGWIAPAHRGHGLLTDDRSGLAPPRAPGLVSTREARPPVARDPRPLPDLGLGGHAPADDRRPRCAAATTRSSPGSRISPRLARARESSVLAAWSGLGYYARARNLHAAARGLVCASRRPLPARSADPRDPAGVRRLHGRRGRLDRLRRARARGRRQRDPGRLAALRHRRRQRARPSTPPPCGRAPRPCCPRGGRAT